MRFGSGRDEAATALLLRCVVPIEIEEKTMHDGKLCVNCDPPSTEPQRGVFFVLVSGVGFIGVSSTKLQNATRNVVLNVLGLYMLLVQGSEVVESREGGSLGR